VIICGDALTELKKLDAGIVQTCVTSPPYWGLRDYGIDGQLGLEHSPEAYVSALVEILAEVKRVLRDDGTLWLVLGDSYANTGQTGLNTHSSTSTLGPKKNGLSPDNAAWRRTRPEQSVPKGLKPKDLVMIPARVALALQSDGWYLRSDIIWHKPNPMPESVKDRPTSAHEHIFLLAKSERYYYDGEAIMEPAICGDHPRTIDCRYQAPGQKEHTAIRNRGLDKGPGPRKQDALGKNTYTGFNDRWRESDNGESRNKRNVWTVPTQPYPGAHFAVYPPALIEPCILAGSREGDTVLDPFFGSGTTGLVAVKHRRQFIGIELNPEYVQLAEKRLKEVQQVMF
jgi:DNA modification methylase